MEKQNEKQFTEKAFGLSFFNGQWGVMEVKYNLNGEVSSDMIFTAAGDSKADAIERYKIMVSELFE